MGLQVLASQTDSELLMLLARERGRARLYASLRLSFQSARGAVTKPVLCLAAASNPCWQPRAWVQLLSWLPGEPRSLSVHRVMPARLASPRELRVGLQHVSHIPVIRSGSAEARRCLCAWGSASRENHPSGLTCPWCGRRAKIPNFSCLYFFLWFV